MTKWFELIKDIPAEPPLYCVWRGDVILYIGTSVSIKARLISHTRRDEFASNGADRVTFMLTPIKSKMGIELRTEVNDRLKMERWLIKKNEPPLNKIGKICLVSKKTA